MYFLFVEILLVLSLRKVIWEQNFFAFTLIINRKVIYEKLMHISEIHKFLVGYVFDSRRPCL